MFEIFGLKSLSEPDGFYELHIALMSLQKSNKNRQDGDVKTFPTRNKYIQNFYQFHIYALHSFSYVKTRNEPP